MPGNAHARGRTDECLKMNASSSLACPAVPSISAGRLVRLPAAGAAGLAATEAFARLAAPLRLGRELNPSALIQMSVGLSGLPAQALHLLAGLIPFPLGYVLVVRPRAAHAAPGFASPVFGLAIAAAVAVLPAGPR